MRKLREVLRLSLALKLGPRAIERSCRISSSTVSGYVGRAKVARLTWPLPAQLDDDAALERLLFPDEGRPRAGRPEPDWARIHLELRKKHVTKALLWEEHKSEQPDGLQYSQFCEHYNRWAQRLTVTMRQTHRAGEKMFVDFSGDGIDIVNPDTGECVVAKLFLAVLGASNLTYVEPVLSEDLPTWTGCHVRALEFFGGVPEIWVPDNLKSGVKSPSLYEPELNQTYAELARHYEAAVIPARVRKPRDKAKVEQGVLLAERWILAALRNRTFFSLAELRDAVKPLLEKLNNRPMQKLKKSRRQLFEELERPALKPLPAKPYEFAHWARPRLHIDYHVEFAGYFYSAPYQLVGLRLDVRATESTIELFFKGRRVTSHVRRHDEKDKYAHADRAHAKGPPGPGGVDTGAPGELGEEDRPVNGEARRGADGPPRPPAAGLQSLPGHPPPQPALRGQPHRSRVREGPADAGLLLEEREGHPEEQPRPSARGGRAHTGRAPAPRQRPGAHLLPLTSLRAAHRPRRLTGGAYEALRASSARDRQEASTRREQCSLNRHSRS
jgi:transposase